MIRKRILTPICFGGLFFCGVSQSIAMESEKGELCEDVLKQIMVSGLEENPAKTLSNFSLVSRGFLASSKKIGEDYLPGVFENKYKKIPRESLAILVKGIELTNCIGGMELFKEFIEMPRDGYKNGYKEVAFLVPAYAIAKDGVWVKKYLVDFISSMVREDVQKLKRNEFSPDFSTTHEGEEYKRDMETCNAHLEICGEFGCLSAIRAVVDVDNPGFFCGSNVPDDCRGIPIERIVFGALKRGQLQVIKYFFDKRGIESNPNFFFYRILNSNFEVINLECECVGKETDFWEVFPKQFDVETYYEKYGIAYFDEELELIRNLNQIEEKSDRAISEQKVMYIQLVSFLVYCDYKKYFKTYKAVMTKYKELLQKEQVLALFELNKKMKNDLKLSSFWRKFLE